MWADEELASSGVERLGPEAHRALDLRGAVFSAETVEATLEADAATMVPGSCETVDRGARTS